MDIKQSINRAFNLLATSIVGLAGLAFLPEAFLEKDVPDKMDDITLFLLAVIGTWWYNRAQNRYIRSMTPVVLVVLALIVKIGAIFVELDDADAVGDDFGGLILFIAGAVLVLYQYRKTKKLLEQN